MTLVFRALLIFVFAAVIQTGLQADEAPLVITPGLQLDYADTLFSRKDHAIALVEYKRFAHFFPYHARVNQARFRIASCLFHLGQYKESATILNDIILKNEDPTITFDAVLLQSDAFLNLGNKGYAELVLQNYLQLTDDLKTRDRIYLKLGKLYLAGASQTGKTESLVQADSYFSKVSEFGRDRFQADQYAGLAQKARETPRKSPTTAGLLSVVPGGGFLYCERYKDAMVSFLLNTGMILATWKAWDNDNKALAGVIGFVEAGFYTGNIYGGISSAHKYNKKQVQQTLGPEFTISPAFSPEDRSYGLVFNYKF